MKPKSILLVDDEQIVVQSLSRELAFAEFEAEITTAACGKEAIEQINARNYDLVVTDLMMPGLDGFQVLKAAKKKNGLIIVIILTGYGNMKYAIDALRLGADDFLQKPCDPDELIFRISNCLEKQELQKKVAVYEHVLPMCSSCKRIRDDRDSERGKGQWHTLEEYLLEEKGVLVSHGCCPDCFNKIMQDLESPGGDKP